MKLILSNCACTDQDFVNVYYQREGSDVFNVKACKCAVFNIHEQFDEDAIKALNHRYYENRAILDTKAFTWKSWEELASKELLERHPINGAVKKVDVVVTKK